MFETSLLRVKAMCVFALTVFCAPMGCAPGAGDPVPRPLSKFKCVVNTGHLYAEETVR